MRPFRSLYIRYTQSDHRSPIHKGGAISWILGLGALVSLVVFFQGCGGGGASTGSGLGTASGAPQAVLRISFGQALNLSKSKIVSDLDLSTYHLQKPEPVQDSASFSWNEVLGENPAANNEELSKDLAAKSTAYSVLRKAVSGLKDKICQFRVTITASDLFVPIVANFPDQCLTGVAPPDSGVVQVDAGLLRKVRVEGIGLEFDGTQTILAAAEATLDLSPSVTTNIGGEASSAPLEFEEVDTVAPVTAIFIADGSKVEGPHRQAVEISLDNFESLTITYRVSEKDKTTSTLSAVTTGFVTAAAPKTISLNEEGTYVLEFQSRDGAGNLELLNEREVAVNFNTNPPQSVVDYSGRPSKMFAGGFLGFSIEMQNTQTGTISYTLGSGAAVTTRALKNKEVELVKVGIQGVVPADPIISLSHSAQIPGSSAQLSPNLTAIELTDISVDGQLRTTFEGAFTSVLTSGVVVFCDTDSNSIYASSQCNDAGKRILLLTGPFSPGVADEFPCIQIIDGVVKVVDEGPSGTCQSCTTYEGQTGLTCP